MATNIAASTDSATGPTSAPDALIVQPSFRANDLATVAIGFAVLAIVTAYLQFVPGNESSSTALRKTSGAAIGLLEKHRLFIPTWRGIKVLYPVVSLKLEHLVRAAQPQPNTKKADILLRSWWKFKAALRFLLTLVVMVPVLVISWYLALVLRYSVKQLEIEGRVFEAVGTHCVIKTADIPPLGKLFISRGIPKR
jgi:hypothetical protein